MAIVRVLSIAIMHACVIAREQASIEVLLHAHVIALGYSTVM